MAEAEPTTRTCSICGRHVRGTSRGMCGNCYRIWQRDNFPPNATCAVCDRDYFRRPSASPNGHTCSRECYSVWKRGRNCRNQQTDGSTLIDRACEWCGRAFHVEKRQVDRGFGRFCSLQCNGKHREVPRLLMSCERCGKKYEFLPNRVFITSARFCSRECYQATRHEGKLPREDARSRSYRNFRDSWLTEHSTCERCGIGRDLLLHHRIRSRERPDLLFDPDNLVVLCRSCHTQRHGDLGHMRVPQVQEGAA